jgi:Protein of unknown function (DUF3738)
MRTARPTAPLIPIAASFSINPATGPGQSASLQDRRSRRMEINRMAALPTRYSSAAHRELRGPLLYERVRPGDSICDSTELRRGIHQHGRLAFRRMERCGKRGIRRRHLYCRGFRRLFRKPAHAQRRIPRALSPRDLRLWRNGERSAISSISSSMDDFRRALEDGLHRPVIDETGLDGYYDFKLAGDAPRPMSSSACCANSWASS